MALTNTSKPTTTLANTTKVLNYETWDSNTSTWDTETRTWDEMGTLFDNTARPDDGISLLLLENGDYLLTEGDEGILLESSGGMTNTSKP